MDYLPILILLVVAVGFAAVNLIISHLLGPKRPTRVKLEPYECGMEAVGDARLRFSVRFYLIAMLFILFDVEAIFLYPWAVVFRRLKLFGFLEMLVFISILFVCYLYVWKRRGLEWE